MKKLITFILFIIFTNVKLFGCDTSFIKMNRKYVLENDSVKVSIIFFKDSTYTLRGEKSYDRWISYGRWYKVSNKKIHIKPNKGKNGISLNVNTKYTRIKKIDYSYYFVLKDEYIEILLTKYHVGIKIDNFIFE
jgi:hypothetical protein